MKRTLLWAAALSCASAFAQSTSTATSVAPNPQPPNLQMIECGSPAGNNIGACGLIDLTGRFWVYAINAQGDLFFHVPFALGGKNVSPGVTGQGAISAILHDGTVIGFGAPKHRRHWRPW